MRLLLDEMYSPALAEALRTAGHAAEGVWEWDMGGASDAAVLESASQRDYVVLTENVADFVRLASEYAATGRTHAGVLIALSSRFSRRRAGIGSIVNAIGALGRDIDLTDRVIYLR